MKFSIITPTLNAAATIQATLESIQCQTYGDWEQIVMDGGSTDDTLAQCRGLPRVTVVQEEDEGQSDAINKGFERASGDIFAWQNADDTYEPDTFERVAKVFSTHPDVGAVYGDYRLVTVGSERALRVKPHAASAWYYIHGGGIPRQPTLFWRRDVHQPLRIEDRLAMDVDVVIRMALITKFHYIPHVLGSFRVHPQSKTSQLGSRAEVIREHRRICRRYWTSPADECWFWATLLREYPGRFVRYLRVFSNRACHRAYND